MMAHLLALVLLVAANPKLTPADARYLEKVLSECLIDPTGLERVSGEFSVTREGWLVRGKLGKGDRVVFADGFSLPSPKKLVAVNFVKSCQERYAPKPPAKEGDPDPAFEMMRKTAEGVFGDGDLTRAAWLHRLGHDDLAAKALAAARMDAREFANRRNDENAPDARDLLRADLAWEAFVGLVYAYAGCEDDLALSYGNHFFKRYPDYFVRDYQQAERIVGELNRRKKEGRFGPDAARLTPNELPADLDKRIAALIGALDDVNARQWSQPGGVNLGDDWRVKALIEIGEPAIPALLDAFETDERLTRSFHYWRDFARSRIVLGVREAELVAIMSILRVRVFEPASTGDSLTARGEDGARDAAIKLRKYWATYGKLPFDERMMKILTDHKSTAVARREAAENLGTLGTHRTIGTTVWSGGWFGDPGEKPNSAIKKFTNPTTAEAILLSMGRELKSIALGKGEPEWNPWNAGNVESHYLDALITLGDKRIAPTLAKRAGSAKSLDSRRMLAFAAFRLGEPKPFEELAKAFETGSLNIARLNDPPDQDGRRALPWDLRDLVSTFIDAHTPVADKALSALTNPKHPYHAAMLPAVLVRGSYKDEYLVRHPYCLPLLRRLLDDTEETGGTYKIEKNELIFESDGLQSIRSIPEELQESKLRKPSANVRVCDTAAERVAGLVIGLPAFHPLRADSDAAIKNMKEALDCFRGRFRLLTRTEAELLGLSRYNPSYAPEFKPLAKAATPADVAAGRAIFHLNGKGQPAGIALPAIVTLRKDDKGSVVSGLAVQAELGAEGIVYGVLFQHGSRAVPAAEVGNVQPAQ